MKPDLTPGRVLALIDRSNERTRKLQRSLAHQERRRAKLKRILGQAQTLPLFAEEVACEH